MSVSAPLSSHDRLLAVIETLSGNEIIGMRLKEIAESLALPVAQSTILRDLEALQRRGWAQQTSEGRWTLGSRPYQCLHNFYSGLRDIQDRVAEVSMNYTRIPT